MRRLDGPTLQQYRSHVSLVDSASNSARHKQGSCKTQLFHLCVDDCCCCGVRFGIVVVVVIVIVAVPFLILFFCHFFSADFFPIHARKGGRLTT